MRARVLVLCFFAGPSIESLKRSFQMWESDMQNRVSPWLLAGFLFLTACGSQGSRLLGRWAEAGKPLASGESMEFLSDKTVQLKEGRQSVQAEWSILDDGRVKLTAHVYGITKSTFATFDGDLLALDDDGKIKKFKKLTKDILAKLDKEKETIEIQKTIWKGISYYFADNQGKWPVELDDKFAKQYVDNKGLPAEKIMNSNHVVSVFDGKGGWIWMWDPKTPILVPNLPGDDVTNGQSYVLWHYNYNK